MLSEAQENFKQSLMAVYDEFCTIVLMRLLRV